MIFADKLILLRKKAGWSQEELAEEMNVSRQSVSKWEGAQSIPDLEKMIRLSKLFGVSTDYLLKDEIEQIDETISQEEISSVRKVSIEEANKFLSVKETTAKLVSYGVFLCILSPICLIILCGMTTLPTFKLSESSAVGIGVMALIVIVAIAVAIFVFSASKTSPFEYMEKEIFETEYSVRGMVEERRENYRDTRTKNNIIGTFLCIMSVLPIFCGIIFDENNGFLIVLMVALLFAIVGVGVMFFVRSATIWGSYDRLLQEGDYKKEVKKKQPIVNVFTSVYWLLFTAIYLAYSFARNNWESSWIIWVVAGLLYPAIVAVINATAKKK